MGFTLVTAVATPELIGVLVWWGLLLAAPLLLMRGWRRRGLTVVPGRGLVAPGPSSDALPGSPPGFAPSHSRIPVVLSTGGRIADNDALTIR